MTWIEFPIVAGAAVACWTGGSILNLLSGKKEALRVPSYLLMGAGTVVMVVFLVLFWQHVERPPLRTLGETRLWYATLIPLVGFIVEYRWKITWLKFYCMALAAFFLSINLIYPDILDKTLMPALQSVWFVPHVIVYMIGYVFLAAASAAAWHNIYLGYRLRRNEQSEAVGHYLAILGFVFLTFGLLFGAFWAKEAWGHYWTWDPKETRAFLAWLAYLACLLLNAEKVERRRLQWFLGLAFVVLLVSWFGVNYLPSAQSSVHSYQPG
ncbi:MAG: cytochrome c biogenesis protein CcsA [Chlorobium phaeobacteroides]|uniref:Cytochrome c assembly protein n=1 Tax=Chlorobium phaeobacteroides (strain BS1) TaxID=331678 RepID=B3EN81_CHLPB|nr:cytochrome c biogenesis protein CcsA [Chlorobium phaeobacteroides]